MNNEKLHNPHAGEILKCEFLDELNLKEEDLATNIGLCLTNLKDIIQGNLPINAEVDLRLCRYFGLSEGYFLRLQNAYELMEAKRKSGETLKQITPLTLMKK